MRRLMLGAVLITAMACATTETPEARTTRMASETAEAKTAIDAINVRYATFMNGNLADSLGSLFAEDGVVMPPNMPAVSGRAAIQAWFAANPMPPGSQVSFTATDVQRSGDIVVERGTSSFTMPASGNTPAMSMPGKYLVHWHWTGGQWLQKSTIWSDDAPAPGGG